MRTITLAALGAFALVVGLSSAASGIGNAKPPRIYVANGTSGTIAEYALQSHQLLEWSQTIPAFGATGNAEVSPEDAVFFMPAVSQFYKLHIGIGQQDFHGGFDTFAATTGPIAMDAVGQLYAIDDKWNSVDVFREYFKRTRLGHRYSGGGIGKGSGLATHIAVDSKFNIWVTANNATVTVFESNQKIAFWTYPAGTVFADAFVDPFDSAWILYQSPTPTYFPNATSCTPVKSGPVTRYQIAMEYVHGAPVATLYGSANENPGVAHVVVDANLRVYVSAAHQVLDFDPGTQCPNEALTIDLNERSAFPALTLYGSDLYLADPVANAIDAYSGGTTKRLWSIPQPSGQSGPVSIIVR